jgi:hypothetical protein
MAFIFTFCPAAELLGAAIPLPVARLWVCSYYRSIKITNRFLLIATLKNTVLAAARCDCDGKL